MKRRRSYGPNPDSWDSGNAEVEPPEELEPVPNRTVEEIEEAGRSFAEMRILQGAGSYTELAENNFEDSVVRWLCSYYHIPRHIRDRLVDPQSERCTFIELEQEFPAFPYQMMVRKWPNIDKNVKISHLFGNFPTQKFTAEWLKLRETYGHGTRLVLVFAWPRLLGQKIPLEGGRVQREPGGGQALVLHTQRMDENVPGTRIIHQSNPELEGCGLQFVIEPLSVFVQSMDTDWLTNN